MTSEGMQAMLLQKPAHIPRTEYSVTTHWPLVSRVTGIDVTHDSPDDQKRAASRAFEVAWNFGMHWSILIGEDELTPYRTYMGHAVYADGGVDFNDQLSSPFADEEAVLAFDPLTSLPHYDHKTLVGRFNEHYAKEQSRHDVGVTMTGIYVTGISGLLGMFGWDNLLMAAGTDPDGFGRVADRYAAWIGRYFDALADSDAPVVMVHDDIVWTSGAFVAPAWYRKYVFPHYKKFFRPLRDAGKIILFTSDGTYDEFVTDVADAGVSGFVMEPTTDMAAIADRYGQTHAIVGNADTRILLFGSKDDIENEVKRCMTIGRDCPGFIMAVGNHIPSNTPVENALWYNECYEKYARR